MCTSKIASSSAIHKYHWLVACYNSSNSSLFLVLNNYIQLSEKFEKYPQKISDEINFIRPNKNGELYFKVYNNNFFLALKMENRRILKIKNLRHLKQVIKILEL